jgi:hypothetical protein
MCEHYGLLLGQRDLLHEGDDCGLLRGGTAAADHGRGLAHHTGNIEAGIGVVIS